MYWESIVKEQKVVFKGEWLIMLATETLQFILIWTIYEQGLTGYGIVEENIIGKQGT